MKLSSKRILVTGATGFIGANLVRKLINQNHQVHILKRKKSDIWRIKDVISKLDIYDVDLLEKEKLSKIIRKIKPNVIFHLANLGLYGGIDPNIEDSIKINTFGTINLIQSADSINYECFINTGSSSEYGIKQSPMKETDTCEPTSNYAISKLAGTLYASLYAKKTHKPLVTLRIFSPFGPYDHPDRLITQAILKMLRGEQFFSNNPYSVRDYIFIEDVIEAYLLCMKNSPNIGGEIFNIGSGKQVYIQNVINLLAAEMKIDLTDWKKSNKNDIVWQADIRKAKRMLNWYPREKLTDGLKKTITWFKNNRSFYD